MVTKIRDSGGSIIWLLLLALISSSSSQCDFDAREESLICNVEAVQSRENASWSPDSTSSASVSHAISLEIHCQEPKEESFLRTNHFGYLPNLQALELASCRFRSIPSLAFSGLSGLKRLAVIDSSASSLELTADAFQGPNDLRSLDLSGNNAWTLPEGTLCSLHSLSALNLSGNFLQDVNELGFSDSGIVACRLPLKTIDLSGNSFARVPNKAFGQLGDKLQELDLSRNNLHLLEDEALSGLGGLNSLNLADNQLVALPPAVFESCRSSLRELHLQNNSLSGLAPGLLNGLERLVLLNLSGNALTDAWLKPETFSSLMRLVALDLSHNQLTTLDKDLLSPLTSLQLLDLSHNRFKTVPGFAFANQFNLHSLKLNHNAIASLNKNALSGLSVLGSLSLGHNRLADLSPRVLQNNTGLVDLDLAGNLFTRVPTHALKSLAKLRTLDLGENEISQLDEKSLAGLSGIHALSLARNGIEAINKTVFKGAPNVRVLNLSGNKLAQLEQGIFNYLKKLRMLRLDSNALSDINGILAGQTNLKWLNVSSNGLLWFDYAFIPKGLEWLDISGNKINDLGNYYVLRGIFSLRYLDASNNIINKLEALSLPDSLRVGVLKGNRIRVVASATLEDKSGLERLDLSSNLIKGLQLNALSVRPNLTESSRKDKERTTEIFLAGNPFVCDCEMEWIQRINELTHPLQRYPRVADLDDVECSLLDRFNGSRAAANGGIVGPGRNRVPVSRIRPDQFLCQYQAHCFALCKCCDFFACDCRMQCPQGCSCFHDATWSANVIQCSKRGHLGIPPLIPMDATTIYLDGNNFTGTLISQAFIGRKKVRHLFLNGSQIEAINNQTFNGLTELEALHLEDNLIARLEGYEFGNLTSLEELHLRNNVLRSISDLAFQSLKSLVLLDLSNNRLRDYPVWDLRTFPSLTSVFLSGNEWSCACDFVRKFKDFASSNLIRDMGKVQCDRRVNLADNVTCSDAMAVVSGGEPVGGSGVKAFIGALPVIIAAIAVAIIALCTVVIAFVFRTPLRVWLHSKYGVRILESKSSQGKLYDCFVAYSLKDEDFVQQILVPQLEHDEPSYKLCLQHRDLPTTSAIADTFPGMSQLCGKHLLVVSKRYLESEWREIKFAIRETKKLKPVILLLEDLSSLDLAGAPEFNVLLKSSPVVRWNEPGFWNKVRFYLPDPRLRAYRRSTLGPSSTGGDNGIALHSSPKPFYSNTGVRLDASTGAATTTTVVSSSGGTAWQYDNLLLHSNNSSSTSTRSGVVAGSSSSPRALSSTSGSSSSTEAVLSTPSHQHRNNVVANPLWQQQPQQHPFEGSSQHQHTYQTIEPIYHTLEPTATSSREQQQYDTLGRLDVMLPNGQMVPATLVRNAGNGRLVPLVEVNSNTFNGASSASAAAAELNFRGSPNTVGKRSKKTRHFL